MNLTPFGLLLQCFGKHQLSHPVDPFIPRLDREMMGLARGRVKHALLLGRRHQLETKGGRIAILLLATDLERFEGGAELGGGHGRACHRVLVHVDRLELIQRLRVPMHGETSAI